jgi:hypothetical protein
MTVLRPRDAISHDALEQPTSNQSLSWSANVNQDNIDVKIRINLTSGWLLSAGKIFLGIPYSMAMLVLGIVMFFVWLRCPTILSRATFWAEDGWVWYPQCYAHGWHCLLIDHSAYLQTISMLTALASQMVSLINAPKFFAWVALIIQAAPAAFLISTRLSEALPSRPGRIFLAALLIASPGMLEVYVNLTNTQWHLALLAFFILCANPANDWPDRVFDTLVLTVAGLSGPFSIFLTPVAILWYFTHRKPWVLWRVFVIGATASIQLALVLLHQATRHMGPSLNLGFTIARFDNVLLSKIIGVTAFGYGTITADGWDIGKGWLSSHDPFAFWLSVGLVLVAILLGIASFIRGPWILRAFVIFVGLEFAASSLDGLVVGDTPLWVTFEAAFAARYWFHPILAWIAIVFVIASAKGSKLRPIGVLLLICTLFWAIPMDWGLPALPMEDFRAFHHEAKVFAHAEAGSSLIFPTRPFGQMVLQKQ